ncbi:hypothetical protein E3U55_14620 [Filobacillus milosensis]|uniref:DUF3221 domain-containing protein n=1 Tax=Filobacillus milosensis TaxID=94137 RepID=A0A4Y8IGA8_9BACI|nr:hypothetical protein [Filobacillus milosensis]TFB14144.1 hypothetical protein E3U55_14620 [Filobacillus milosensis]
MEYADGHTFWHHINLQVELNGQVFEWTETTELYKDKLLIGGRDDKYLKFRDGKMNFNLAKEEKDISCNPPETEKGDFIIDKGINYNPQILVANDIIREDVDSKTPIEFIKEDADLMWYTLEDKDLYEDLTIGEKVIVKMKTFKEDGEKVGYISQSDPPQANASKVIRCDK